MISAYFLDLNGIFLKSEYITDRMQQRWGVHSTVVWPILNQILEIVRKPNAPSIYSLFKPHLDEWGIDLDETTFLNWWFTGEILQEKVIKFCIEKRLKGIKIFIVSNSFKERVEYYEKDIPAMLNNVDKAYFSYEVGYVKPDPEYFKLVLKENNLKAEEVIYIDDSEKNLESAKTLGIRVFNNFDDAILVKE
jgi:beta-phosphoglucomutase-like phosphatase (HAD superfamily)